MATRLNYTGRKRIAREDANFSLKKDASGWTFDALLSLGAYRLPADASVYVEAYRQATWMRFAYGRVGSLVTPPVSDRVLSQFSSPEGILFRVKVTAAGATGKLLAEADKIRPRHPDDTKSHVIPLIDTRPANLGAEIWRVDLEGPSLLVNERLSGWKDLVLDIRFRALVAPAVMRQVLARALELHSDSSEEDVDDPFFRWLQFAQRLPGIGPPPSASENEDGTAAAQWIDAAVESFGHVSGLFYRFSDLRAKESQQ